MCTLCNCRLCSVKHRTLLLGKLGECTLFCLVQCTVWAHYRCAHLLFVSTVYYIAHCAQHWAEHWCSNWGRRILTICEHCELCTELCAISTMYCSLYCCALCSNWSTVQCALCTVLKLVHCVLCTVNCAVALCWNWGTVGTVHCAQTGAGGVGGLGARQASRSSSGKGKWTNLFGTQTISPPPLILRLHTKFTQLLIIHALAPA